MKRKDEATTIAIGDVTTTIARFTASASACHPGNPDHVYILRPKASELDSLALMKMYPTKDIKVTSEYYIDDSEGCWYAFCNVDCFDPPFAIIRTCSFETAYEIFCAEWERWIAVDAMDAKDYPEDDREYNTNGTHVDAEGVNGFELQLIGTDLL